MSMFSDLDLMCTQILLHSIMFILLNLLLFVMCLTFVPSPITAQKRLDMDDFHHLGNFLRSMQTFNDLDYLYKPFQQYIVQRSLRGAAQEIPEDDEEERLFFSLFTDYGQTNSLGVDWSTDDVAQIKAQCVSLVKLMTRRRRLESETQVNQKNSNL